MILATALIALVVGLLSVPPVLYFGIPLGARGGTVTLQEAVAVALVGIVVSGVAALLFGWLPVVGVFVAPVVWVDVTKYLCPVAWPAATGIGLVSWAIQTFLVAVIMTI